ncbi:xanthine dehydrogenase [Histoplasma capsulatum G186AR]|uniref:Xanthine dehydrogenase n=1 Tax=Ajellomyces capsulatus TaxID=5037 RepID=A0A8H7YPG1_AJECA|nr:xanthine dehydrogenase [Histoplasma capsulatum]QSS74076.1 xanthine dehydrogenase [Histoplasma capsulatum G186AR]
MLACIRWLGSSGNMSLPSKGLGVLTSLTRYRNGWVSFMDHSVDFVHQASSCPYTPLSEMPMIRKPANSLYLITILK